MFKSYEDLEKFGKDSMGVFADSFGTLSKGLQALAAESTEFTKKSFEASNAAIEKLVGAKTLENAIAVQTEFARSSYEAYIAQTSKVGAALTSLVKESYKPFEGVVAKAKA